MNIVDLIKSQIDTNGDGRISKEDLEVLKEKNNNKNKKENSLLDQLISIADKNGDGKVDLKDLASLQTESWLDKLKGMFSGKK